jgi:hypothetical protein
LVFHIPGQTGQVGLEVLQRNFQRIVSLLSQGKACLLMLERQVAIAHLPVQAGEAVVRVGQVGFEGDGAVQGRAGLYPSQPLELSQPRRPGAFACAVQQLQIAFAKDEVGLGALGIEGQGSPGGSDRQVKQSGRGVVLLEPELVPHRVGPLVQGG